MDGEINWYAVMVLFNVAQCLFTAGTGVWVYLRTKDNDNAAAVAKVAKDLDTFILASEEARAEHENRMTRFEESVRHMPTPEDFGDMREDVAATKVRVEGFNDLLRRVEHQSTLIWQALLDGGRR